MLRNKVAISIAIILALTFAVSLVAVPLTKAHDPPLTVTTYAYIAVSPDPVGVGQSVLVVIWISPNPPSAAGLTGDRWRGTMVKITDPNGDTDNLGPFTSDPTGSTFTSYTPDVAGDWTFEVNYPGQVLLSYNPDNGLEGFPSPYVNDTFSASSSSVTITVQDEVVQKIPDYPLPTQFWTRPIEGQNEGWYVLGSNWLQGSHLGASGFSPYKLWQKDGIAPGSAHVMWTYPTQMGGIAGGTTEIPETGFYSGGSYEGRFANAIIMYDTLYFALPLNHEGGNGGYIAIDMKTGEEKWYSTDLAFRSSDGVSPTPAKGQLFEYESINQHGIIGGVLWTTSGPGGSTWDAYDAWSGNWLYTLTNVPGGTEVYTDAGEIVRYVLNYNTTSKSGWMALWNNTQDRTGLHRAMDYTTDAYQWRPNGKTVDMGGTNAYSWNVTITSDLTAQDSPAILNIIPGDIILGRSTVFFNLFGEFFGAAARSGTQDPYTFWALSDRDDGTRGNLLWKKSFAAPGADLTRSNGWGNPLDEQNRVFFTTDLETFQWQGYDLDSGAMLWETDVTDFRDFQYYGSGLGGGQLGACGEGKLFVQGFGGDLYCYDTLTGDVLWKYSCPAGAETAWGQYPVFVGAIADGKVYAFNNEHSPNYPLYKGERVRCLNATTGEEIWTLLSWAGQTGGPGSSTMVLAAGAVCYYNYYDNQIYCIAKGPSATTVSINDDVITEGNSVLITGTVTDESPGAKAKVADGVFNMVPAMSDESQGEWMEYIYMQKPCPSNATGVDVRLTTLDPNGNYYDIGTATTDGNGFYSIYWAPPVPGMYTVIATFEGSESYWTSYSETAFAVMAASPTPPPEEPITLPPTDMYILVTGIVIIIAIAIATVLIIRRR